MPSATHEGILAVLRANPGVLELLLARLGVQLPAHDKLTVVSENHGQVQPIELRSDGTIRLDSGGVAVLTIVPEVQLSIDPQKLLAWPSYMVSARHQYGCPALVVVITLSRRVADWARQPIDFGFGSGAWAPVVLGPGEIPEILDIAEAAARPELAVLSAIAHGQDGDHQRAATIALAAIKGGAASLMPEQQKMYNNVIRMALSVGARKVFEMIAASPDLMERLEKEWRETMRSDERIWAKAEDLLAVLQARGLSLSDEQRKIVDFAEDEATLDRWIRLAATVSSANALFED